MLKKDAATSWNEDCQKAFYKIKEYMSTPPVLVLLERGRPLLLYLSVLDRAFDCILGQHDETRKKEQAIYYLSKKFTPYEAQYSLLKREGIAEAYDSWRMFFDGAAKSGYSSSFGVKDRSTLSDIRKA
uniref:Reverse transcriptase/retrotransposon-derived protein RNase H-like domain-containing protein n=1 Tax=Nicotiana tabacum TaxID=4097 RepID=A0A1S3XNL3_TOBAC|nr:PREDICTED: uncharacterized protein LOC107767056 [Nicotiana tabacum]